MYWSSPSSKLGQSKHEIHGNEKPFSGFKAAKDKVINVKHQKVRKCSNCFVFCFNIDSPGKGVNESAGGVRRCPCRVRDTWVPPSQPSGPRRGHVTHQNMIKGPGKLWARRPGVEVRGRGKPDPEQVGRIRGEDAGTWIKEDLITALSQDSTHRR